MKCIIPYLGYSEKLFYEMLNLAVSNTYFFFNNILYKQKEGLAMGNPLAPTLANIFLGNMEDNFLNDCPVEFKPLYYRRYLDDIFAVFSTKEQYMQFYDHISGYHANIEFTVEEELNGKLSFLDVMVTKEDLSMDFSVYRKPTYTMLGTSYFSFIPNVFKINAVRALIHRAYHLSSSFSNFQIEIDFLRNFFDTNGFPKIIIDRCISKFLNKIYTPPETISTVPREEIYIKLSYLGKNSDQLVTVFQTYLRDFFPQINFKFVFTNDSSIGAFFKHKENLPDELRSHIIYKYICDACQASYIGSTVKQSKVRFFQHMGVSHRTSLPIAKPVQSSIRDHCEFSDHRMRVSNFSVVASSESWNLRTLESIYILNNKPLLNIDQSATPLYIL